MKNISVGRDRMRPINWTLGKSFKGVSQISFNDRGEGELWIFLSREVIIKLVCLEN